MSDKQIKEEGSGVLLFIGGLAPQIGIKTGLPKGPTAGASMWLRECRITNEAADAED